MSADEPLLSMEDVEVHYTDRSYIQEYAPDSILERFGLDEERPVRAVDGVSIDIEENDVLAVVGESGSGKTTLGKTAIGLQRPTGGRVRYNGHDIWEVKDGDSDADILPEDVQRALQIIHQDPGAALNPYRRVGANLEEPLKRWNADLDRADRRERITRLLTTTGIAPAAEYIDRYPHQLSGGEQQRVALVRALLMQPDLILADEAVSALDASLRVDIMDLMLDLQDEFDTSYIFISHNLSDARYFAQESGARIAVMYLGQLVEVGPSEQVIENPQHPYTKLLRWASAELDPDAASDNLRETIPVREMEMPDPENPPTGCNFSDRCAFARPTCQRNDPPLYPAEDESHTAACFRLERSHEYWEEEYIEPDLANSFEEQSDSDTRSEAASD